jgi:hypothetical protein
LEWGDVAISQVASKVSSSFEFNKTFGRMCCVLWVIAKVGGRSTKKTKPCKIYDNLCKYFVGVRVRKMFLGVISMQCLRLADIVQNVFVNGNRWKR